MAFNDIDTKKYENILSRYIERIRPNPSIRNQDDISFKIYRQSVEIFEIRPDFLDPSKIIDIPVAKSTYIRSQNIWKIYWRRADLNWHLYEPQPQVNSLDHFIDIVERDQYACFWG
jgi:hypothetical protein